MLKTRFPFSKPSSTENSYGGNNAWAATYNNNNNAGFGFVNPSTSNSWGNNNSNWGNNWGSNSATNNPWGNNNSWGNNNNAGWGNNNNWSNNNQWQGSTGGMGGIMSSNPTNTIATAQKYVGKQKQTLTLIHNQYLKVL